MELYLGFLLIVNNGILIQFGWGTNSVGTTLPIAYSQHYHAYGLHTTTNLSPILLVCIECSATRVNYGCYNESSNSFITADYKYLTIGY